MQTYLLEDLETEEQLAEIEAKDLEDALEKTLKMDTFDLFNEAIGALFTEKGNRNNIYIGIRLPFGKIYRYEIGEEGK
jgi:hypothetical protein